MGHIFISYSHSDKDYAHKLQEALQNEGFDVWIDDRIDYGDEWPMIIQEHLDTCQAFILIATENSYKSRWVQKEVARAQRIDKAFFPLLLSGHPWLTIESTQYVDVRNGSLPPDRFYGRLASVVPRVRERNVEAVTSTTSSSAVSEIIASRKPVTSRGLWNAERKRLAARIGTGAAVLIFVVLLLFVFASRAGFINTDNTLSAQSPMISNLVTTMDRNNLSNIFSFSKDQPIYVRFDLNSQMQTMYTAKWYYVVGLFGNRINFLVTSSTYTSDVSDTSVYFHLNSLTIPGTYRVDIYNNETLIGRRYFTAD